MAKPSMRAFLANFRSYDAPLAEKVRLSLRNTALKGKTRTGCCGHPGEPGC